MGDGDGVFGVVEGVGVGDGVTVVVVSLIWK